MNPGAGFRMKLDQLSPHARHQKSPVNLEASCSATLTQRTNSKNQKEGSGQGCQNDSSALEISVQEKSAGRNSIDRLMQHYLGGGGMGGGGMLPAHVTVKKERKKEE
eukprot:82494-Pelagomonas_calceolata.AAC.1